MPLAGKRVLVVEDEAVIAMLVEDYLAEMGWETVATATRLDEAISKARTLNVDIAVLDVNLAGRPSYPVAEALRERQIPFLFATGYTARALPAALADAVVLAKPFGQKEFVMAFNRAAGCHQSAADKT